MENKQMDKRHQRTDDKSKQKTTNGFKNSTKDQQKPNADIHRSQTDSSFDPKDKSVNKADSKTGSDWNSKNQPTEPGWSDHEKPGSDAYQSQYSEKGTSETRSDHRYNPLNPTSDQPRNQQTRKNQDDKDHGKWEGQDMNHPTKDKPFNSSPEDQYDQNPNHNRDTEPAGVIDEDRGPFQDEEMEHQSRKRSYDESGDTENSNLDFPKKKNQAPPSKFS